MAMFGDAASGQMLVKGLSNFALELYTQQNREIGSGNAFMSLISIASVLNMALLGARGPTLTEMKTTMFLNHLEDDSKLHQAFSDLISHLNRSSTEVPRYHHEPLFKLQMANRIYGEESSKVLDEFQESCLKYYGAGLVPVSFVNDSAKAADEINSWVLEQTNQKIKDIISSDAIDATTKLILVNAIYFKSSWNDAFERENTKESDFFVSPTETRRVKMMHQRIERASYYQSNDLMAQVLKLPYVEYALSMYIILPNNSTTLEAVEKRLTADHLHQDINRTEIDVRLWLPKFKFEETLELSKVLQKMGMKSLFEEGSADLSGIDGTRELYASKVVHKSFVDVNEEGTEAAAANADTLVFLSYRMDLKEVDFRADRPFLFFIREEESKAILFLGRVVRPEHL